MKKPARSLACGIATVSLLGIGLSVGIAGPAGATPADAPSWADVQAAKADQAAKQKTVDELSSRLSTLQDGADQAGIVVQQAGQTYSLAASEQQEAQSTLDDLGAQSKRAKKAADDSAGQVAALVVELSRTGGGDLSTSMLVDASDAKDLLYQVGTMAHLSERSATVLAQAEADQKTVESLAAQKRQATKALAKATATTKTALDAANDTAAKAQGELTAAQDQQDEVLEQLAFLKGSTVAAESAYFTQQRAAQAEAQLAAQTTATGGSGSGSAASSSTGGGSSSAPSAGGGSTSCQPATSSGSGSGTGTSTAPQPAAPQPAAPQPAAPEPAAPQPAAPKPAAPKPSAPKPATPKPSAPAPAPSTPSRAAGAIAFARAQIGDAYEFGGEGPNAWDCSGLVMAAYSSQGIATGGHNVVWQYNYFKSIGRLVPMSQRQPGDILFYSNNGAASGGYHDSIYTGNGRMVEAANVRVGVVERAIWTPSQLLPYVARPSGSL